MPVGVLTLEIQLPYAHSLKEKRAVLRKMRDRLRSRFNVAVAELNHEDVGSTPRWEWFRSPIANPCWNRCSGRSWPKPKKSWAMTWRIILWSFSESRQLTVKSRSDISYGFALTFDC